MLGESIASGAGAIVGAVIDDVVTRMLSVIEQRKVNRALTAAATHIGERWVAGHRLRVDVNTNDMPGGAPFFREIAEGMITVAQKEHQERKLDYIGRLVANLAYVPNVDHGSANWALRAASELSWDEYILLALVSDSGLPPVEIGDNEKSYESWTVHRGLQNLRDRKLIGAEAVTPDQGIQITARRADHMELGWGGHLLVQLMDLQMVPLDDRTELLQRLSSAEQTIVTLED